MDPDKLSPPTVNAFDSSSFALKKNAADATEAKSIRRLLYLLVLLSHRFSLSPEDDDDDDDDEQEATLLPPLALLFPLLLILVFAAQKTPDEEEEEEEEQSTNSIFFSRILFSFTRLNT
jgi:hypothetical protein